jgi:hypothetical protein
MYTSIAMSGTVATLLNRDAMLNASVSAGSTILNIGDSYMDRGTNSIYVFATGCTVTVGTESHTIASVPGTTTVALSSALANDYPIYTPVLRTDYFDIATSFPTLTAPGSIRIGMEEVTFSSIDVASTYLRYWIDARGSNAYPHTEWAPVVDASFTMNSPADDSPIAT